MGQYSIKDVETLSGLKAHTLRIWEQRYGFLKPERTDTNIRYYTDEQLKLIIKVATLNRRGMKISKIATLDKDELSSIILKIHEEAFLSNDLLEALILAMLDFDEKRFEKTLSNAIVKLGFEKTFVELIFPFLVRTGVLWLTGSVRVVQEHFISNLIRRKICVATDSVFGEKNENPKKFILFLPEGETHEMLLLFTEYLLRKHNHEVVYLGSSLPFNELEYIKSAFNPDFLVTYQTVSVGQIAFEEYLEKLCATFPDCKVIVGGSQLASDKISIPSNCKPVTSIESLLAAVS